ncbi:flagellar basal body rod protein FlgB [Enterovirga rhinocerotis]|uniref:Flagellar basal body rod protein FlgB n=1 Tax=Enterovirga rhinocerotis TaxID=1339210 RepID=A0A4R7BUZ2_9HYPH|nr:flagellar basal body rod protein FlgB [Enterovirga rhinocerotis]TDR89634.1 flagellar basal-body rod protein FlgB [Enterovirga rhinocerotis]
MSMTSLPIVTMLRDRMQWHQTRQKFLAENVSNADMPGFRPKDLAPFQPVVSASSRATAGGMVPVALTDPMHLTGTLSQGGDAKPARRVETRPSGNAVNLEEEMLKVAENQSEYQLATSLYQKSLAMLRIAAGVKGA